jgi:putative transposase
MIKNLNMEHMMAQSLSGVYIHVIFSTKDRKALIPEDSEKRLHNYLATVATDLKCHPFEINGTSDHVHLLLSLHRTISQSDLVEKLKAQSSRWYKTLDPSLSDSAWQGGYGIFSVDLSTFDRLRDYIVRQKEHHKTMTFKEEYLKFLKWSKVEFDDKFLWD